MVDAGGQHVPPLLPPKRAAVTPRVRTSPTSGALPLERVVRGFLDAGARGIIVVHAPPGGGKTAALSHLHAVLPELMSRVYTADEPTNTGHLWEFDRLSIVTQRAPRSHDDLIVLELVPWAEDEWIEYLAANHRGVVPSVLSRLKDDATRHALNGAPQLWTIVLDAMARDPLLATAREALRRHVRSLLPDSRAHVAAGDVAVKVLGCDAGVLPPLPPKGRELPGAILSLLRHPVVRLMLAGDSLAMALAAGGAPPPLLAQPLERDLLAEAGVALRTVAPARAHLADLLRDRNRVYDAAAASLLLAADPDWHPRTLASRLLRFAHLDGARWSGIDLRDSSLVGAALRDAHLVGARLNNAKLHNADCSHADLTDATLRGMAGMDADFTRANLRGCDAEGAQFFRTRFEGANLGGARLGQCDFASADLTRATLRGAVLAGAKFAHTIVEDTDFSGVTLAEAVFTGVDLRVATLSGTSFARARLNGCNLEGIALSGADFSHAHLAGSLFTGSRLPWANFRGARLNNTGLADIDWPHADLRSADFTGASFPHGLQPQRVGRLADRIRGQPHGVLHRRLQRPGLQVPGGNS